LAVAFDVRRDFAEQKIFVQSTAELTSWLYISMSSKTPPYALTYYWVTTDVVRHPWVHTRPIYYSQKD
jgi:hypothetical protein